MPLEENVIRFCCEKSISFFRDILRRFVMPSHYSRYNNLGKLIQPGIII
jgi:hypothetical protein